MTRIAIVALILFLSLVLSSPASAYQVTHRIIWDNSPEGYHLQEVQYTEKDVDLLALNVYREARGEGAFGELAVFFCVLNRMKSNRYHSTVQGVIKHPWAFSWTASKLRWKTPDSLQYKELRVKVQHWLVNLTEIEDLTYGATHYYNPDKANPKWAKHKDYPFVVRIGNHNYHRWTKD